MRESVFAGVLRRHEGLRDKREKEFLLWIISCGERSDKRNEILPVKFRTGLWGQDKKRKRGFLLHIIDPGPEKTCCF